MRVLDEGLIAKILKHDISTSTVLSFSRMGIGCIEYDGSVAENILLIDASHNCLKSIAALWKTLCPSAWWINASFNQITHLSSETIPYALGSLNLADNEFPLQSLNALRFTHILRLRITGSSEIINTTSNLNNVTNSNRSDTITLLPYIWVLDDEFINYFEKNLRIRMSTPADMGSFNSDFFSDSVNTLQSWSTIGPNTSPDICQNWGTRIASEKEQTIIRLIQSIPLDGICGDYCRLDVLLEDYLEEIRVMNIFHRTLLTNSSHSSSNSNRSKSNCSGINMLQLLSIPHKIRLDLSVLMTASIFFSLSLQSYKDTLILLLSPYLPLNDISCYLGLPSFVNTALVSVIRRICRKEIEELNDAFIILPKPSVRDFPYHSQEELGDQNHSSRCSNTVTYMDIKGFNHLEPLKFYLNTPTSQHRDSYNRNSRNHNFNNKIINNNNDSNLIHENKNNIHYAKFSELELEILTSLPDIPTKFIYPTKKEIKSNCWINFLASQTILLLSQGHGFSKLSKNSCNKKTHDLFIDLKPLLELSSIRDKNQNISQSIININRNEFHLFSTKFRAGLPGGKISELLMKKNKNIIENKIKFSIQSNINSNIVLDNSPEIINKNEIIFLKKDLKLMVDINDSSKNIENIFFRKKSEPVVKNRKYYHEYPKNKSNNITMKNEVEVKGREHLIVDSSESEANQNNSRIDGTNIFMKKKSTFSFNLNQSNKFIYNESVTDSGDDNSIYSATDERREAWEKSDFKKENEVEPNWRQQRQQREMSMKTKKIELNGKEEEHKCGKRISFILPIISSPSPLGRKSEMKLNLKNKNSNEVSSGEKGGGNEVQEKLTLRDTIEEGNIQYMPINNINSYSNSSNSNNIDSNITDNNVNNDDYNDNNSTYNSKHENDVTSYGESTETLIFSILKFMPPALPLSLPISPSLPLSLPISPSLPLSLPISPSLPLSLPISPSLPLSLPISLSLPLSLPSSPSLPLSLPASAELKLIHSPSGKLLNIPDRRNPILSVFTVKKNYHYDQEDKADDKRADGNIAPTAIVDVEEARWRLLKDMGTVLNMRCLIDSQKMKNENIVQNWYPTLKTKKSLPMHSHESLKSKSKIDAVHNIEKETENLLKIDDIDHMEGNVFLTASTGCDEDDNLEEPDVGEETDSRQFSDSIIEDSESENNPVTFELSDGPHTIGMETAQIGTSSSYREKRVLVVPYEFRMKRNPLCSVNKNDFKVPRNMFIQKRSKPLSSNSSICSSSSVTRQMKNRSSLDMTNMTNNKMKSREKNDYNDYNDLKSAFFLSENQSDENMQKSWYKIATHKINLSKSKADTHWDILRNKQHSSEENNIKPFSQEFKVRTNSSFSLKFFESPHGK